MSESNDRVADLDADLAELKLLRSILRDFGAPPNRVAMASWLTERLQKTGPAPKNFIDATDVRHCCARGPGSICLEDGKPLVQEYGKHYCPAHAPRSLTPEEWERG